MNHGNFPSDFTKAHDSHSFLRSSSSINPYSLKITILFLAPHAVTSFNVSKDKALWCLASKINKSHYGISFSEITQRLTKMAAQQPEQPWRDKRHEKTAQRGGQSELHVNQAGHAAAMLHNAMCRTPAKHGYTWEGTASSQALPRDKKVLIQKPRPMGGKAPWEKHEREKGSLDKAWEGKGLLRILLL